MKVVIPKKWKSGYRNNFYEHPILKHLMFMKLSRVLREINGKQEKILEIGPGFGYMLINLLDRGEQVVAIDQNTSLEIASEKPFAKPSDWSKKYKNIFEVINDLLKTEKIKAENLKLVEGFAWDLLAVGGGCDTVIALDVFEHVEPSKRIKTYNEISQILKTKGRLIYSVPNTIGGAYKVREIIAKFFGQEEDADTEDHKNYDWANDLENIKKEFNVVKIINFPIYFLGMEPSKIIVCEKK